MFIFVKLSVRVVFVNNLNRDNKSAKEYDDYIQVPFQPPANLPNHTVVPQTERVKCGKTKRMLLKRRMGNGEWGMGNKNGNLKKKLKKIYFFFKLKK